MAARFRPVSRGVAMIAAAALVALAAGCDRPPQPKPDAIASSCTQGIIGQRIDIPAGITELGAGAIYPEEAPAKKAHVQAFSIDATEVTNRQFRSFVEATGYRTRAERGLVEEEFADLPDALRVPGSSVFIAPKAGERSDITRWWQFVPGANWRHPEGPRSDISGKDDFPVVHIGWEDAKAYADWAGRRLPTEDEWEYAARGGRDGATYEWGEEKPEAGTPRANTWQGVFPYVNEAKDGFKGLAPVACYAANGFGLYDMTGNVWEWTESAYTQPRDAAPVADGPESPSPVVTFKVAKGGSFLCAENYCARYRPAARHPQDAVLGTSHMGFRTVGAPLRPTGDASDG
ncbi:formylglycine-generating enzyme required for sulfatase activity [Hephaestia caeni]|uniref:Formylglycine-generating enzyme required for sulfatase activity n=2 Tax=Hephaestia caeni TaxID=645617 RepID=A0A397PLF6_9SPHN|nr:formylglycine-generating enzyme required for sulfatase activity [Hephaestia caeni]